MSSVPPTFRQADRKSERTADSAPARPLFRTGSSRTTRSSCRSGWRMQQGRSNPSSLPASPRTIGDSSSLGIRNRSHSHTNLGLSMALDSGFRRSAAFLAPDHRDFSAWRAVLSVDDSERKHGPFVVAVTAPRGYTDGLPAIQYFVVRQHGIHRGRKVDVLDRLVLTEHRCDRMCGIVGIPDQRHFLSPLMALHLLESLAARKVVVELDDATV